MGRQSREPVTAAPDEVGLSVRFDGWGGSAPGSSDHPLGEELQALTRRRPGPPIGVLPDQLRQWRILSLRALDARLPVQAPGTGRSDTGYLWAICRDERRWNPDSHPGGYYHYAASRSGEVAERLLEGGSLQFLLTDGYAGYNRLFKTDGRNDGLTALRCWAHSRPQRVHGDRAVTVSRNQGCHRLHHG